MIRSRGWLCALAACAVLVSGCSLLPGRGPAGGGEEAVQLRLDPSQPYGVPAVQEEAGRPEEPDGGEEEPLSLAGEDVAPYRIRAADSLVVVMQTPNEQQMELQVDENGVIKLPLLDDMVASGLTASELGAKIRAAYLDNRIYRYITVNVFIPSRSYYVRGEVRSPGRYPLQGGMTLVQAIATAGGYTDFANARKVKVLRGAKTTQIDAKDCERYPERDINIETGDVIVVPRSFL